MALTSTATGTVTLFLELFGDLDAPASPIWGAINALLNAATLVAVALIYTHRK